MVWHEDELGGLIVKMEGAEDYSLMKLIYKDDHLEGRLQK